MNRETFECKAHQFGEKKPFWKGQNEKNKIKEKGQKVERQIAWKNDDFVSLDPHIALWNLLYVCCNWVVALSLKFILFRLLRFYNILFL